MAMVPRGLEPRSLRLLAVRSNELSYETLQRVFEPGLFRGGPSPRHRRSKPASPLRSNPQLRSACFGAWRWGSHSASDACAQGLKEVLML